MLTEERFRRILSELEEKGSVTVQELMEQLDERFFRVGRSAVVNLNDISRVTRSDIYLTDGRSIPLPRGAYDKLNRAIIHMK